MGKYFQSIFLKGPKMGNFMDICDQKLIRVQVVVDRNGLNFPVAPVAEVSQFALPCLRDEKIERLLLPQIPTIICRRRRHMLFESCQEFILVFHDGI
jgi:hypothetical protein